MWHRKEGGWLFWAVSTVSEVMAVALAPAFLPYSESGSKSSGDVLTSSCGVFLAAGLGDLMTGLLVVTIQAIRFCLGRVAGA